MHVNLACPLGIRKPLSHRNVLIISTLLYTLITTIFQQKKKKSKIFLPFQNEGQINDFHVDFGKNLKKPLPQRNFTMKLGFRDHEIINTSEIKLATTI